MAPVTLAWGSTSGAGDSLLAIAQAKGYFAEQRITLDAQQFATATQMVAPLSQNQLQVAGGTVYVGMRRFVAAYRLGGVRPGLRLLAPPPGP